VDQEAILLEALHEDPGDESGWLALCDWLEERGDPRAELMRLRQELLRGTDGPGRAAKEGRLRALLDAGVRPCVPVLTNSIGMRLALVPPGTFWMGAPPGEPYRDPDEGPRHRVEITRPFYLGVYLVTQQEYERLTGTNPSWFRGGEGRRRTAGGVDPRRLPVECVSYNDGAEFCRRLSLLPQEKGAGRAYRLPTEAEWEYACRAGTTTAYHYGHAIDSTRANIAEWEADPGEGSAVGRTTPVGSYAPNAFGVFDMHGNVWEWCADWYSATYYRRSPAKDPQGPKRGRTRVLRGGDWDSGQDFCRCANRGHNTLDARHNYNGFRVALSAGPRAP
jgi:uncharacterized protein (TIGR02996 family)